MKVAALIWIAGIACLAGCKPSAVEEAGEKPAEAAPVAVETVKAIRRSMRTTLEVTGTFNPSQGGSAKLTSAAPGRIATVNVKEGDHVRAGEVLATIESKVQQSQQAAAQAGSLAAAQQADEARLTYQASAADHAAAVRTAEQSLQTAKVERDSAVTQANFDYQTALADLRRIRSGARPQELAQAHQATVQAEVTRDRARRELQRDQALSAEGFIARRQLEDAQAAAATAESALAAAQANESLIREGARPEELRAAELKAAAARQAVENARKVGAQRVAQAETALNQARQAVLGVEAKARDATALSSLARQKAAETAAAAATSALAQIRAPYDGQIVHRLLNPGDFADSTTPILEIAGSSGSVDFVASLPAADAASVRPGMEAEIELANGKFAAGRVVSVSPADPQTGLAGARIATSAHAVPGSFGQARIVLGRNPNAIAVPKETLLDRDGQTVVFLANGDTAKMAPVVTGAKDAGFIEVKSGVKAGDTLVRLGQYELSDGAKIKVAEPAKSEPQEKP
ncbi:efflux RND transporter periplasmic adaptor subunit [Fimbriimonas ginsengisoli]|uniref:Membrane fusion protein n=1 Tax=Fimbriimonas ginsengisoli Gsoil 348 TaxID=661478 RepID=A0A068NRQ2_FIMGI|nr:efflux RND transporter periplasmic adaptor subunit [Fimbriimonas ginsengisoli]AIE86223.1 membrane fusion protein [Fimbriimonas ginsengisoli Gsoil 348]